MCIVFTVLLCYQKTFVYCVCLSDLFANWYHIHVYITISMVQITKICHTNLSTWRTMHNNTLDFASNLFLPDFLLSSQATWENQQAMFMCTHFSLVIEWYWVKKSVIVNILDFETCSLLLFVMSGDMLNYLDLPFLWRL